MPVKQQQDDVIFNINIKIECTSDYCGLCSFQTFEPVDEYWYCLIFPRSEDYLRTGEVGDPFIRFSAVKNVLNMKRIIKTNKLIILTVPVERLKKLVNISSSLSYYICNNCKKEIL
jgi:hypothetical protein